MQRHEVEIIDNAYDAIVQRKTEKNEDNYRGRLDILIEKKGKNLGITIRDNGIGVRQEDLGKIFTPFFTTKLSSKKGTGLGMYVIHQIIEENHSGKVSFNSIYGQGVEIRIILPIGIES